MSAFAVICNSTKSFNSHSNIMFTCYISFFLVTFLNLAHIPYAGNFRGVLIFIIFVTIPRVTNFPPTKFSTHKFSVCYILRIGLRESQNLKPRKLILKTRDSFSRKFAPPKITRYTVYSDIPLTTNYWHQKLIIFRK